MVRKIAHAVIYVGVAFAFPALPLAGIRLLWNVGAGVFEGSKDEAIDKAKEQATEYFTGTFWTKEGMIPRLWDKFNPFE
jgi:hypothetical protein